MEEKIETDVTPQKVEEPVITKKDPRRVEQGKRLAAISKEAKEKKMRERIKEEEFSYLPWLGYSFSIISSLGLLYFVLFNPPKKEEDLHPMTIIREHPKTPPHEVRPKKNFESLN